MGLVIPSTSALMCVRAVDLSAFETGSRMTFLATRAKMVLRTLTDTRFVMVTDAFFPTFDKLI